MRDKSFANCSISHKKSFANPIVICHVTCQFPWCLEVRDSKSEMAFNEEDVYVVQ